jgi:hypothetical protein
VDGTGTAADPVRAVHWLFYMRDAPDDMPRVEGSHRVRVPRGVDPHGGVDVVWAMGNGNTGSVAAAVARGWGGQPGRGSGYQVVRAA